MSEIPTIDTIRMVREIRDRMNEATKNMTREERIAYINRKGGEANARFREMAERSAAAARQSGGS
jgi:hypothetical protein